MTNITKTEVLSLFSQAINSLKKYEHTHTYHFLLETYEILNKSEGVAFIGTLQRFFNEANVKKFSDNITFDTQEQQTWDKLFTYKQLGNNLWGVSF